MIVKSVYACWAADWIAELVDAKVVITLRDPRNTISSWQEMGWLSRRRDILGELDPELCSAYCARTGVDPPRAGDSQLVRAAWMHGVLTARLLEAGEQMREVEIVRHEELLDDPETSLGELASRLGLRWSAAATQLLASADRAGGGYEPMRERAALADVWRTRLNSADAATIASVLAEFPH